MCQVINDKYPVAEYANGLVIYLVLNHRLFSGLLQKARSWLSKTESYFRNMSINGNQTSLKI